jgi:mannose-1-phosphate guanylyltransferase
MKAFILAAGCGTRLRPLTDNLPKCLVPIAGKPMLQIWLETCRAAGITDVLINLHAHADRVRDFVASFGDSLQVTLSEEYELLGSAGTLRANRRWLGEDQVFWVLYSDVLTNVSLRKLLTQHRRNNARATLGVYHVENPQRCGIVTTDSENRITAFVEKPERPTSDLAFSGIMVATPEVCNLIPANKVAPDIGFDLLPQLVGQMYAYPITDFLMDIGTHETYERAQREWPGKT